MAMNMTRHRKWGLLWRNYLKKTVQYFLFIGLVYQINTSIVYNSLRNLPKSIYNIETESNYLTKKYREKALSYEDYYSEIKADFLNKTYIDEVCHDRTTKSVYKNMTHEIVLSFESSFKYYEEVWPKIRCYKSGTNFDQTRLSTPRKCVCRSYYYGTDCGIPAAIWHSKNLGSLIENLKRRTIPKRILNGFLFNHEFDMLEARLWELRDAVDVFIILESKYTSYGEEKPLRFYDRFQKGYLKEFRHKILYVYLDRKFDADKIRGSEVDHLLRCFLSKHGLARIKGAKSDDIFILSDADEIPSAIVLNFLKLYDGLPEVAKLVLKWNVYGFFWQVTNRINETITTDVFAVTSISDLENKMDWNAYHLRQKNGAEQNYLTIGTQEYFAGWHCSWCFSPEGIVLKMNSAHEGDPPRLGNDPDKKNLKFIKECIKNGTYFYDAPAFKPCQRGDYMFAPQYIIEHFDKYKNLLSIPYQ